MKLGKTIWRTLAPLILVCVSAPALAVPQGFQEEVVISGRQQPVYLTVLPDGRMLLLQKQGLISIFDPTAQPVQLQSYLQITNLDGGQERGLTSLAIDPDFATNGYIYVYYTHGSSDRNRISRFTHSGNSADPASEVLIWEDNEDHMSCCHFGGGIGFGPDGKLYLTTGEEFEGAQSTDLTRAGGKVIRINKDGTAPNDNPFVDGPGGNLDEIWAYGLRNPFRAAWDFPTGRFFIADVGGNVQATAREEINVGVAGADYGWPNCEGQCPGFPATEKPIFDYPHTAATPAGGAVAVGFVYRGSEYPAAYNERLFYGDYAQSFINMLTFNPDGTVDQDIEFHTGMGAPVHLVQGPDDLMYVVDFGTGGSDGRVLRYTYSSGGGNPPVIQSISAAPNQGTAPLTVNFSVVATDPENDPLTYRWEFGDGTPDSTAQNPSHTYTSSGPYYAFVEVSDGTRSTFSELQLIQVGNVPVVTILSPNDGDTFRAGDTIAFSGTASDPDETIPASNYSWEIRLFHNAHTHPVVTNFIGTNGTLDVETMGHDWHDDTGFEFVLTVTDSDGLIGSDTIRIYPEKVDVNLSTSPAGIPVFVDGILVPTPIAYDTLIGFQHEISVPGSYCLNGQNYIFDSWSNGGDATQTYVVPDMDVSLSASFVNTGACQPLPQAGLVLRLEADTGVATSGGSNNVTSWADQSGSGNDLTASGTPQLIAGSLNGEAVIDFDGNNDVLRRLSGINGLPEGSADRTVYAVVNYIGTGYGGVSYGTPGSSNQTFGLAVHPNGNLMVQGWGTANDFDSGIAGSGMGWMIQSVRYQNGTMRHYQDGTQIDQQVHDFNTVASRIVVGAEIDINPFVDMQVAAVYVYDRALQPSEIGELESYLDVKYFGGVDIDILSPLDGGTVSSGDVPVTYAAAGTGYDHIQLSLDGGPAVNIMSAAGTYTFSNVAAGPHTVTAVLVDANDQPVSLNNSQTTVSFTAADCFPDNFAPNCTVDSDSDGTPDSAEGATTDSDGDGTPDYLESSLTDSDNDGTVNQLDPNNTDPCIPSTSGTGCSQPRSGGGGGSLALELLMALAGVLAIRRRRPVTAIAR